VKKILSNFGGKTWKIDLAKIADIYHFFGREKNWVNEI